MASIFSTQRLTRGTFVKATVAAGGGRLLSLSFPRLNAVLAAESNADFTPNAFVRIEPDGKVTFTIPQVEMGQGIYTALSMILAEELDAPFEHVTAVAAPWSHICAAFRRSRIPMRRRPNRRTRSPGMSPERAVIHRASRSMRKPVQAATDGRAIRPWRLIKSSGPLVFLVGGALRWLGRENEHAPGHFVERSTQFDVALQQSALISREALTAPARAMAIRRQPGALQWARRFNDRLS
jgi:Molybdopterin-binding domain of aldehyde dehydrogenase